MPDPTVISFFLSKTGAQTRRIAGPPGNAHLELAGEELVRLGQPVEADGDLYASMFRFGYARVRIYGSAVYIDVPRRLSTEQQAFAVEQEKQGKSIVVISHAFDGPRQK